MSVIDPAATLADLLTANPRLAPHLDRLGLDYCCGGQRRLMDAAEDAGLDMVEVLDVLGTTGGEPSAADWGQMGPAELVDHIEATHHVYLLEALPRLTTLAEKVTSVHRARHPELDDVQRLLGALTADLEPHLQKEERVLFPLIRESAAQADSRRASGLAEPIRIMRAEHDGAGDLLARLRAVTGDFLVPDDGCASYRALYAGLAELEADTHLHVHKENNVLFPAVVGTDMDT